MTNIWDEFDLVVGIDPGYGMTGVVCIDQHGINKYNTHGSDASLCHEHRTHEVAQAVCFDVAGALNTNFIDEKNFLVCMENNHTTGGRSAKTALMQRELIAVICVDLWRFGAMITRVSPSSAKKALTGSGRASKEDMVSVATEVLGVGEKLSRAKLEALADALGIALCGSGLKLEDI